jgi:hypothetical protein
MATTSKKIRSKNQKFSFDNEELKNEELIKGK